MSWIGWIINGTVVLLRCPPGRAGYDGSSPLFYKECIIRLVILIWEPQFDDSKRRIRQYELLMSQHDESQQAKLENTRRTLGKSIGPLGFRIVC